jgi:N-acetylmuramoyl-L-alanine amidase
MLDEDRQRLTSGLTAPQIAALTAYREAGGTEPILGVVGVLAVIKNRVERQYRGATSYAQVCLRPAAFSCWNDSDPNLPVLLDVAEGILKGGAWSLSLPAQARVVFETCLWLATRTLSGEIIDPTKGALHYLRKDTTPWPNWARAPGRKSTSIGMHEFWVGVA